MLCSIKVICRICTPLFGVGYEQEGDGGLSLPFSVPLTSLRRALLLPSYLSTSCARPKLSKLYSHA